MPSGDTGGQTPIETRMMNLPGDRIYRGTDLADFKTTINPVMSCMRRARTLRDGAKYYVTARANHQKLLMENDTVKQMFLDNFAIMGNHFHLIIQPIQRSTFSAIMKWILQTFAIRYNKANSLWGHFWGGRYFSWIIPNFREFLRVFAYVDNNPVRAELTSAPEEWKWGALWLRRTGPPAWLGSLPTGGRWSDRPRPVSKILTISVLP